MPYSTLVLFVWVFLVSIDLRGWVVRSFDLSWVILIVAVVYIVVRTLEWSGKISRGFRDRA